MLASAVLILAVLCGCGPGEGSAPNTRPSDGSSGAQADGPRVFVSILPQVGFVKRVGGDRVTVEALVKPGQSPHAYEPAPKQMAGLSEADLYLCIGVPFEQQLLPRLRNSVPALKVVKCQEHVALRAMQCDHEHHDHDHHHAAGEPDPHIWLDPRNVKTIAANVCDALCAVDPEHAERYRANLATYQAELDALHTELTAALAPLSGEQIFVYHPAYGYFADAYGLKQVAVEAGGREPTQKQITQLIEQARAAKAHLVFVQPQFSEASAKAIASAIGGTVMPLDPLAENYEENLREMAERIRSGLTEPKTQPANPDRPASRPTE